MGMLKAKNRYMFIVIALTVFSLLSVSYSSTVNTLQPPSGTIPMSFFGMHVHRALINQRWPKVQFKGWRLWDAFVAWPDLETNKGQWNFETLDRYLELAENNNIEILLPLGLSPSWASARQDEPSIYGKPGFAAEPKNLNDWKDYVRTIATRYKGRIHYYEIWNEPNVRGFYSGSVAQMVSLAREAYLILKEIDPSIMVVSPSATGGSNGPAWLDEYLAKGGGEYADVIGYHFYVTPSSPETMLPLISKIKSIMEKHNITKPLWNTEAGWDKKKHFKSDDEAAAYVARSFILNWAAGVSRFYWYAWDNKDWVSLRMISDDDSTPTSAGIAYGLIQSWLIDCTIDTCKRDPDGIWTCSISKTGAKLGEIIWSDSSPKTIPRSMKPGYSVIDQLDGSSKVLKTRDKITITNTPIFLQVKGEVKQPLTIKKNNDVIIIKDKPVIY